jgi:hypothetical protein
MVDAVLLNVADPRALDDLVARARQVIRNADGLGKDRILREFVTPSNRFALMVAEPTDTAEVPRLSADDVRGLAYTGWVPSESQHPRDLLKLLTFEGDTLVWSESPGGIAGFFFVDGRKDAAYAWSGLAGIPGIFHMEGPRCAVASNRPLLAHLVASEGDRPSLSQSWARRALLDGCTLWAETPYEGTFFAKPRSTVVLEGGKVRSAPHPLRLASGRLATMEGIELFRDAALAATSVLRSLPTAEFFLSGGKDSRLLAAVLAHLGIDVDAVTYSYDDRGEGPLASHVARVCGITRHRWDPGSLPPPQHLRTTILANLRESDGLLTENRQLVYRMDLERPYRRPIVQGQAHHPRNGYKTKIHKSHAAVRDDMIHYHRGAARFVVDDLVSERMARLDEILTTMAHLDPMDVPFWLYNDGRCHHVLANVHLRLSRVGPVIWPCIDDRVVEVCTRLRPTDRSRDVTLFGAMAWLKPELARVALHHDVWKFDPSRVLFLIDPPPSIPPPAVPSVRRVPEKTLAFVWPLFRETLATSPNRDLVRSAIRPDALSSLLEGEAAIAAASLPTEEVLPLLWSVIAVCAVLDGEWLTTSAPYPTLGDTGADRTAYPARNSR